MAVVVIAGSGRGAGKTAVGCALMAALPEFRWAAVKITPHGHENLEGIQEEFDRSSVKDTGRYLMAGARRSFLATGSVLGIREAAEGMDALLVESNQVSAGLLAGAEERRVGLAVLSGIVELWKKSLWDCVCGMDALVLTAGLSPDQLPDAIRGKRLFWMAPGRWSSPELVGFVGRRIRGYPMR